MRDSFTYYSKTYSETVTSLTVFFPVTLSVFQSMPRICLHIEKTNEHGMLPSSLESSVFCI